MKIEQTNPARWTKNIRGGDDDWTCTHCRKHNPVTVRQCTLCGCEAVSEIEGLARKRALYAPRVATQARLQRSPIPAGLCVRNRTSQTLWFYTETTAPVDWVQLRPGEACDLPSSGGLVATIGARFEEPDPTEVIGTQFALIFGLLAFPLLLLAPEPGSKAMLVWLVSLLVTGGGGAGSMIVIGVSNQSQLKQTGVPLQQTQVWELSEDLLSTSELVSGKTVCEYAYHWSRISESVRDFNDRFAGWEKVEHGVDRGDLQQLKPIESAVIDEIRHQADIGQLYLDSIEQWANAGTLADHVYECGRHGASEPSTISGASVDAGGKLTRGLITEVRVAACKFIDAIQVKYNHRDAWERVTGGTNGRGCKIFGDSTSSDHLGFGGYFGCGEGEYISRIRVWHDIYVIGLQFTTNKNRSSPMFGRRDGDGEKIDYLPARSGGRPLAATTFEWGGGWTGYKCEYVRWMDAMTVIMAEPTEIAE